MILFPILLLIAEVNANELCPVDFCNGTHPSHIEVENFCKNAEESSMIGRCCIANQTDAIIGLDLSSCNLTSLNISQNNFTDVVIMDLRDNELKNVVPDELRGLINLTDLYLPRWINCPGGSEAWNESISNETYCHLQKNPCQYLNISCTEDGDCIHVGPGSAKCVCKPGHYGYKCLNEGEFPMTTFSVTVAAYTVIASVILWFVQGRDPYRKR